MSQFQARTLVLGVYSLKTEPVADCCNSCVAPLRERSKAKVTEGPLSFVCVQRMEGRQFAASLALKQWFY